MDKDRLSKLLDAEVRAWAAKPYDTLVAELQDVAAYGRGEGADFHQFEVLLLENEPDYLHVSLAIDDGSLRRSFAPLCRDFILHRDGRVEV